MATNSPININSNETFPQCGSTCEFTFKYSDSQCVVTKFTIKGGFQCLRVIYESGNSSTSVKYKGVAYVPTACLIFNSSFHTFEGEKNSGELLIFHSGSGGGGAGKSLIVSIPVSVTESTMNAAGKIIDTIIKVVPPAEVTLTSDSSSSYDVKFPSGNGLFNLSEIIPSNTPFYTYLGNAPYSTDSDTIDYIVFPTSATCTISAEAASILNRIVKPIVPTSTAMPENGASMNSIGANARKSGEIYIECNPTGDDGVILYKKSLKGDAATNSIDGVATVPNENIFESDLFILGVALIFVCIAISFIIAAVRFLMEKTRPSSSKSAATP